MPLTITQAERLEQIYKELATIDQELRQPTLTDDEKVLKEQAIDQLKQERDNLMGQASATGLAHGYNRWLIIDDYRLVMLLDNCSIQKLPDSQGIKIQTINGLYTTITIKDDAERVRAISQLLDYATGHRPYLVINGLYQVLIEG